MTHTELIEAAARAIEDAEFGYRLDLTRLVDNESTYVLAYTDGSEPLEFSDTDEAYEHIAHKRATARARAAASVIIEACAQLASEFPARQHGNLPIDPHEVAAQVAREIAAGIRALAPVKEG